MHQVNASNIPCFPQRTFGTGQVPGSIPADFCISVMNSPKYFLMASHAFSSYNVNTGLNDFSSFDFFMSTVTLYWKQVINKRKRWRRPKPPYVWIFAEGNFKFCRWSEVLGVAISHSEGALHFDGVVLRRVTHFQLGHFKVGSSYECCTLLQSLGSVLITLYKLFVVSTIERKCVNTTWQLQLRAFVANPLEFIKFKRCTFNNQSEEGNDNNFFPKRCVKM